VENGVCEDEMRIEADIKLGFSTGASEEMD
jgi:hypothetical protein